MILRWLQENYKAEVIAYTSDIGQEINSQKIIKNAKITPHGKVAVFADLYGNLIDLVEPPS